jgi:solute carrier family 23 (nucleobase transporter), member 1
LVLCIWLQKHPGSIRTGNETLDATLSVLLGTSILVGGAIGCFLDHVIPGTPEERGLIAWSNEMSLVDQKDVVNLDGSIESSTYDFPFGMSMLRKCKWTSKIPFLPTYKVSSKTT